MLAEYDEDIRNNSFYNTILKEHQDLINKAVEEGWIICIPREGTYTAPITIDDIFDHILIPNIDLSASNYSTLSKKRVVVQNKVIIDNVRHHIPILFEETFYNANMLKYTVWCVDQPLTGKVCCDKACNYSTLVTLQDCIDFLCINADDAIIFYIRDFCQKFLQEHSDFVDYSLEVQKESIQQLIRQCTEDCMRKTNCEKDGKFFVKFTLAVETCMQSYLKNVLFAAIANSMAKEEAEFNKVVQNLSDIEYQDLEIPSVIGDRIFRAKCELNKINKHSTILGKLTCLRNTFNILSQNTSLQFTSDDLLQTLIYLIVKLQINNWLENLKYISEFRFTTLDVHDENSFLITSLEAAILYIKSGPILSRVVEDDLSLMVKNSDLVKIESFLKNCEGEKKVETLCHPLCNCNKCERVLEGACKPLRNKKGQTLLHIAILQNKVDVVEFLVEKGCDVDAMDNSSETPLHYAAKKGLQNILLFLVQFECKTDVKNTNGNTPLHLAVNNGHERCVKALIYSSKTIDINAKNNCGNTPLHTAAKWGYLNIIKILIEAGALTNLSNYSKCTAKDVALNRIVCNACDNQIVPEKPSSPCLMVIRTRKSEHGLRPKTTEQQKKLELLLKAIEDNDAPLTCFYLGFTNPPQATTDSHHHPLCSCEYCQNFLDSLTIEHQQKTHCSVNMCNTEGYTPLHIAAKHGRTDIVRLLLDAGATINLKTYKSLYTPLHLACMYQKLKVVRELLKCGECKIDLQDSRGNTPLFYACCRNDVRIFELLLSYGANVKIKNNDSVSVLYEAERKMLSQILKLLKGTKQSVATEQLFS